MPARTVTQQISENLAGEIPDSYIYQVTVETYFSHYSTPGTVADQLIALNYAYANVKSIYMYADVNTTIKTDNSGTPEQTFTLYAGCPVIWNYGMRGVIPNPLSSDIATGWYITGTSIGRLIIRLGYDVP